jgi:hypothetical protein
MMDSGLPPGSLRLEAVLFTVTGILLYLLADRLVLLVERRLGRVLEHRTLLFFVLLLTLALVSFAAIRRFMPLPGDN